MYDMAEGKISPQVSGTNNSVAAVAGSYERCSHGEPTHHVCVMGVSERDDEAVRESSLTFGKVWSIERNAKASPVG